MSVACWGRGLVTGRSAIGRKIGAVWYVDIVSKLIRSDLSCGWWSGVPVTPRIVTGGWGDGSGVMAHIESACIGGELGICAR